MSKKHIHFKIFKINLIVSPHICSLLNVSFFFFFNRKTKNKCKRVTGPWKSTNFCCVHKLHIMKWKYTQFSHFLSPIDNTTLRYDVSKCICMFHINDLKPWLKKKIPVEISAAWWWWEANMKKVVAPQILLSLSYKCSVKLRPFILVVVKQFILCNSPQHFCVSLSLPNALSG